MTKAAIAKSVTAFNKKNKVGKKVKYKTGKGGVLTGTVSHKAISQKTQASFWVKESKGKISVATVVSK